MSQKITDYLKDLGLSDKEASLYKQILVKKQTTVKEVADALNINRITAHGNIERLITIGLVSQINIGARRVIVAEPPSRLKYLVQQKVEASQKLEDKLAEIISDIKEIIPKGIEDKSVKATFYEGRKALMNLYKEILTADEEYSFMKIDKFYEFFPNSQDLFKKSYENNPQREVWLITLDTPFARQIEEDEKEQYRRYHCKYIVPKTQKLLANFIEIGDFKIYNNTITIIQLERNSVSATSIKSQLLYKSFTALHKHIWSLL